MDMAHLLGVRERVLSGLKATDAVSGVLSGSAGPEVYAGYLTNVWHYAQHSSVVIGLAGARCVNDHPKLAQYLLHHALEELGHDAWALEDLAKLGLAAEAVRASRPVSACAAMIGYEYYVAAHANPVGLFGWLYTLEAMGDDLGHVVSEALQKAHGSELGVKFVRGHGEADEVHTKDLTEQITENVCDADAGDVNHVADVIGDLYIRMFQQLTVPAAS